MGVACKFVALATPAFITNLAVSALGTADCRELDALAGIAGHQVRFGGAHLVAVTAVVRI